MPELGSYGSVRGAAGNSCPLYVADCLANKQILPSSEGNGEPLSSLWPMSLCGRLGPFSKLRCSDWTVSWDARERRSCVQGCSKRSSC